MLKSILPILLLILSSNSSYSQLSERGSDELVRYFVDCVRNADIDKLYAIISYPIKRPHPIPPIKNKQELKELYTEIFDAHLTRVIADSDIETDWSEMGWRGIMLHDGIIWLDYDGRFLKANYTTEKEKEIRAHWNESEKGMIHPDLKDFKETVQ